jgi:hypothetical protein
LLKKVIIAQYPLGSHYSDGIKGLIEHAKDIMFKREHQKKRVVLSVLVNTIKSQYKIEASVTDAD